MDAPLTLMMNANESEARALLEDIYGRYHYDFRSYSIASMLRRIDAARAKFGCATVTALREVVSRDERVFNAMLQYLTVQVSDLFRDPAFFLAFRKEVVPVLATYPSFKIWVAGCSTGEEVDSYAIILREEGVLERAIIYATDINPDALNKAEAGAYAQDRLTLFAENHRKTGAIVDLSTHYKISHNSATFDRTLRKNVVFADHSLATDSVFAEVHVVSCRNVLIYFDKSLQERAVSLMRDSLVRRGFLGLGAKETVRFLKVGQAFRELNSQCWYQRF